MRPASAGVVRVGGRPLRDGDPRAAIRAGVAHVPEDRLSTGVAPSLSIASNVVLKSYRGGDVTWGPFLLLRRIRDRAVELIRRYDVRAAGAGRPRAAALRRQPAEGRPRAGVLGQAEGARGRCADARARRRRDRDRPRIPARGGRGRRRRVADQRGPRRGPDARGPDPGDVRGRDRRGGRRRAPRTSTRSGSSWPVCGDAALGPDRAAARPASLAPRRRPARLARRRVPRDRGRARRDGARARSRRSGACSTRPSSRTGRSRTPSSRRRRSRSRGSRPPSRSGCASSTSAPRGSSTSARSARPASRSSSRASPRG